MFKTKNIYTKITALLLITNLVLLGPTGVVLAQEASPDPSPSSDPSATSENTNTGSDSENTSDTTVDQTVTTTNTNNTTATNTTDAASTSGDNTATDNTGDATITTSDSSTTTDTQTTTNTTEIYYEPMSWTTWTGKGDWQTRSENSNTGSDSENTATTEVNQTDTITNTNNATITNDTDASASTGSNTASDNTGSATITTGNASTTTSTENIANTNYVGWTGEGDWTNLWNGEALNWMTGSNSTNESTAEFNRILDVLNTNGVDVTNLIDSFSSTGSNTASDNTGNATITTGDSFVLATLFNLANTNIIGTDAINILYQDLYGSWTGDINLSAATPYLISQLSANPLTVTSSNSMTGFNSENDSIVTNSFSVDILNDNDGVLVNDLELLSTTGSNTTSDNTGNATINTGNADIIANILNFLNSNIITGSFYFGAINVYGDWNGNLILPQLPASSQSSQGETYLSAQNSFTGSGSENNSETVVDSDTALTNTNNGTVINNFDLVLETGANSASDNTMSGYITTGNASGQANQATWNNTNVISDNPWWLVLINNLGSWVPVIFSPKDLNGAQVALDLDDLNPTPQQTEGTSLGSSNDHTGTLSDNDALIGIDSMLNITNDNTGTIINKIKALSLTGENEASRNTGSAAVETGDASILANALNFLNTNIISPSFLLTVVNVFGSWAGDILNFGSLTANNTSNNDLQTNSNPSPTPTPTPAPTPPQGGTQDSNNNQNNDNTQNNNSGNHSNGGSQNTSSSNSSSSSQNQNQSQSSSGSSESDQIAEEGEVLAFVEQNDRTSNYEKNQKYFKARNIMMIILPIVLSALVVTILLLIIRRRLQTIKSGR